MEKKTDNKNQSKNMASVNLTNLDYKDSALLKKFINPHGRILSRKRTSISAKNQRTVAMAIKRARFMGLLPYIAR